MKTNFISLKAIVALVAISLFSITSFSQSWTVGQPVNMLLTSLTHSGGGCYPTDDFVFHIQGSQVTGVDYYAYVMSVPPNTVYVMPGNDTLAVGDSLLISPGPNSVMVYFYGGSGSVTFDFRAIGIPTTAGQPHPCSTSSLWLSNLLICHEGLTASINNNCTVLPMTVMIENGFSGAEIIFPNERNNYLLKAERSHPVQRISIYGISGNEILRSNSLPEINCASLSNGIYFVTVLTADNKLLTRKFVMNR